MTLRRLTSRASRPFRTATLISLTGCWLASCAAKDDTGIPSEMPESSSSQSSNSSAGSTSATSTSSSASSSSVNTSSSSSTSSTSSAATSSSNVSSTSATSSSSAASSSTTTDDSSTDAESTAASSDEGSAGVSSDEGSASTSDETETSGAGGFNPCPTNGDPCKILPFGDSITFGLGSESAGHGGYRVHLFELAVGDSKNITFVGSSTAQDSGGPSGPTEVAGKPFPRDNEGHSGWRILTGNNINSRIPSPALDDDPHIILIHIGTNDALSDSAELMAMNLGTLVDNVITNAPDSLIVVAKIVPFPGQGKIDDYNGLIPAIVEERASAGKHVLLADLNTGYDTDNLADPVHPNKAGYDFMAEKWYEIIKDYLPDEQ